MIYKTAGMAALRKNEWFHYLTTRSNHFAAWKKDGHEKKIKMLVHLLVKEFNYNLFLHLTLNTQNWDDGGKKIKSKRRTT